MDYSIDMLLEFLYDKFAFTFVFCLFGSIVKEYISFKNTKKDSNNKKFFNIGKSIIVAAFSTIMMCAATEYIDFHIGIYVLLSMLLGLWGYDIIMCLINENLLRNFLSSLAKHVTNPLLKSVAESTSETIKEDEEKDSSETKKEDDKKESSNENKK